MKRNISFVNHKGGVAKTTSAVNIGAALHSLGKKVLLIDLDPQANLTINFGKDPMTEKNIYLALKGKYSLPVISIKPGLDIVCSTLDLSVAELELSSTAGREYLLKELVEPVQDNYDYILYDCPPSLTFLTMNALAVSDTTIIPVDLQQFGLAGMKTIFDIMDTIRKRINPGLGKPHILVCRKDIRKSIQNELHKILQERKDILMSL